MPRIEYEEIGVSSMKTGLHALRWVRPFVGRRARTQVLVAIFWHDVRGYGFRLSHGLEIPNVAPLKLEGHGHRHAHEAFGTAVSSMVAQLRDGMRVNRCGPSPQWFVPDPAFFDSVAAEGWTANQAAIICA